MVREIKELMCVYISDDVWNDTSLSFFERCFIGKITALAQKDGMCWAGDERLAQYMTVTPSYIRKAIRKLKKSGHLTVKGYGQSRKLVPNGTSSNRNKFQMEQNLGQMEQLDGTIGTKVGTIGPHTIEHTIEHTKEPTIEKKQTKKKPKDLEEVVEAFEKVGAEESEALAFFDYYEANGWTQGRNKPIKDWKAAARGWIRRSHQFKKNETKRSGPSDGSLLAEHLRRLAADSGESLD
jgi:DNA-binding transcriptional regulator YhcF (GntR family)